MSLFMGVAECLSNFRHANSTFLDRRMQAYGCVPTPNRPAVGHLYVLYASRLAVGEDDHPTYTHLAPLFHGAFVKSLT